MTGRPADRILEGLDTEQREAVTTGSEVVRVIAGPGTGKTRVLTRRVAWRAATGSAAADNCLVVTFTRAAAAELSQRLGHLGAGDAKTGTLHGVAWELVRRWLTDHGKAVPTIVERDDAMRRLAGRGPKWDPAEEDPVLLDGLARRYRSEKARRGLVDFDDVLEMCARTFEDDQAFARAQRWRFRHLFVDEFQDLTPLQFRLLAAWAGADPDIFAVGDPCQSIYQWNGADPSLLETFGMGGKYAGGRGIGGAAATVTLTRNYRSSAEIVTLSDAFQRTVDLGVSRRDNTPATGGSGSVPQVHRVSDPEGEEVMIVRLVRQLQAGGIPWPQIAVLSRTNSKAARLTAELEAASAHAESTTFHAAKGREWEAVVISGAGDMPFGQEHPRYRRRSDGEDAEEARLFYVAMTRAASALHFTSAMNTQRCGEYLDIVERECIRMNAELTPLSADGARAALGRARSALRPRQRITQE